MHEHSMFNALSVSICSHLSLTLTCVMPLRFFSGGGEPLELDDDDDNAAATALASAAAPLSIASTAANAPTCASLMLVSNLFCRRDASFTACIVRWPGRGTGGPMGVSSY